jgi:hypothetical protein
MRKRTLLAVLGGIVAFAIVVASAASLGGLTSDNLGADDSLVASCDTNGVTSSYTTVYNATGTGGFKVDDVTIDGINDACDGQEMTITLTDNANAVIGEVASTIPTNVAITNVADFVSDNVLAEAVTGIHVVITG